MGVRWEVQKEEEMRRIGVLMGMVVLLVATAAGAALADVFIELTAQDDTFNGTAKREHVEARGGDDLVRGAGGGDKLLGQSGSDDLYGQGGPDKLFGMGENDLLVGGRGDDQINGAGGDDVIVAGDDKVADEVDCGAGEDIAFLSGPDHSSLANDSCEEVRTFKSMEEVPNPDGEAGAGS